MQATPPVQAFAPSATAQAAVSSSAPTPASPAMGVRLPLQIGTSSLWSVARGAATLLPGVAIFLAAFPLVIVNIALTGFAGAIGGLLVYYAVMHLRIAVKARPSDVILHKDGLRIEGGIHHGRELLWPAIDPDRTLLTVVQERRYTLARILGNGVAVAVMILAKRRVFWVPPREFDISRLLVALRDGTVLRVAEAERPIERESLEALHDAIRSSGWHAPAGGVKKRKPGNRSTTMGLRILLCHQCGAPAVPDDAEAVPCRYCGGRVPMPPDMREKAATDKRLRAGKSVSNRLVGKLLKQPGARGTARKLLAAGLVMVLAWPLSFGLAALELGTGYYDVLGLISLTLFPVATILGLFFLLRTALADRFALRLLTLDFGAQNPAKEGDPYGCRRCDAPLPDEPGAVVVTCRYCNTDNILGVDLRRDAMNASREAASLEDALAKRAKEHRIFWLLGGVSVLLMGVGVVALGAGVSAMIDLEPDVTQLKVPRKFAPQKPPQRAAAVPASSASSKPRTVKPAPRR